MLYRLRTSALCLWCFLLLHRQAVADEEALWGPTPAGEKPPEEKSILSWFGVPKVSSISSYIPRFFNRKDKTAALTTPAKGLTEPPENLGSGDGSVSQSSELPTSSAQEVPASVTETSTDSSDSPHSATTQINNDTFVSGSHSSTSTSIRNTLFASSPTSTSSPEQNATHTHPPGPSMGATTQHLSQGYTSKESISSTMAPETTVPTALTWAETKTTTTIPGLVETTILGQALRPVTAAPTSPDVTFVSQPQDTPVTITLHAGEATRTEFHPTQSDADQGFSEARSGPVEDQRGVITTTVRVDGGLGQSTAQSQAVNFSIAGELPGKEDKEDDEAEEGLPSGDGDGDTELADVSVTSTKPLTPTKPQSTGGPKLTVINPPYTEDWMSITMDNDITFLPDCNKENTGICNLSDTWDPTTPSNIKPTQNTTAVNQSINPFLVPAPPMLVPLYTDWNSAMAAWGIAWEAHVYGAGCAFAMLTLASALNLLCLPLRCPSGCGYFALVSLFLLAAGCTRSFSLLYDAYGHQDRLPSTEASLMLYEAPFPCLTAAFGLVFLLLSMRSRMQLSYSAFQRPCFLACLVVLHFAAAFGPVTLLKLYQQKPPLCLFLSLLSRGAFVALATFLSTAFFVFYIYVRADSKHIYHLNNTSPTPAERYNRCPFAESRDWDRAAVTVCVSALFALACAGLQLYAILNALGIAGGEEVFHPWPWWAFQFSCRLCELGVCLTLALVVAQPVYCSDHLPDAGSCWTELLASKSPILPGTYQWNLSQHEKLAIVDSVGLGETESLPLYTLVDDRLGCSLNGLDLLYHSNRALAYRDLDLDMDLQGSTKPEDGGGRDPSGGSSFTSDSTTDLRPPSPINLRRSIDEALFSDSLFPMSLFSPTRPLRCSDLSMNNHSALPSNGLCDPLTSDPGLYRTSSCVEMTSIPKPHRAPSQGEPIVGAPPSPSLSSTSSCSSPERWRGSSSSCSLYRASLGGSSLVLCPSPERNAIQLQQQGDTGQVPASAHHSHTDPQRNYQTLGAASQESLDLDMSSEADRSVQEEFISVCRQIDALSVCSETIDL